MIVDMADALKTLAAQDVSPARVAMVASAKEASDKLGSVLSTFIIQLGHHATTCVKTILQQWLAPEAPIELDVDQLSTLTLIRDGLPWTVLHECVELISFLENSAAIGTVVPALNLETGHITLATWVGFMVACASMCSDDPGLSLPSLDSFMASGADSVGAKLDELRETLAGYPEGEGAQFDNPAVAVVDFCDKWLKLEAIAQEKPQALI
jgi:hypothetical protein